MNGGTVGRLVAVCCVLQLVQVATSRVHATSATPVSSDEETEFIGKTISAPSSSAKEQPRCDANQYLNSETLKCIRCAELNKVFHGTRKEWLLNREAERRSSANSDDEASSITPQQQQPRESILNNVRSDLSKKFVLLSKKSGSAIDEQLQQRRPSQQRANSRLVAADATLSRLIADFTHADAESDVDGVANRNDNDNDEALLRDHDHQYEHTSSSQHPHAGYHQMSNADYLGDNLSYKAHKASSQNTATDEFVANYLYSTHVERELLDVIKRCKFHQEQIACQMWSNMCTLSMYARSDGATPTMSSHRNAQRMNLRHMRVLGAQDVDDDDDEATASGDIESGEASSSSKSLYSSRSAYRQAPHIALLKHASEDRLRQIPVTSWQRCKQQYQLASVCNSLIEWQRSVEKQIEPSLASITSSSSSSSSPPNAADVQSSSIYAPHDATFDQVIKLEPPSASLKLNQQIQLLAYKYAYTGQLISIDQFGLDEFARFCLIFDRLANDASASRPAHDSSGRQRGRSGNDEVRVGRDTQLSCAFSTHAAHRLAPGQHNDTQFVDLFVAYTSNGVTFVKPVPVLINNLLYNGVQVNRLHAGRTSRLRLVHRFFTSAALELDAPEVEQADQKSKRLLVLHASKVRFELNYRLTPERVKGAQLNSILLTIDYALIDATPQEESNGTVAAVQSRIEISHSLVDMLYMKRDFEFLLVSLCVMSSAWSLIECYNAQKCAGASGLSLGAFFTFLLISCNTVANVILLTHLILVGYLFASLKLIAGDFQILFPDDSLDAYVSFNMKLAFALKLIGLARKLQQLSQVDIFFIDWERPKMLTSTQILGQMRQENNDVKGGKILAPDESQLSFWRPYTIVGKWLRLITFRRESITLQLIAYASLVIMTSLDNWATRDSSLSAAFARSSGDKLLYGFEYMRPTESQSFRLWLLATSYLLLSACQILFKKFVSERAFCDKLAEFVDLCSVANVSVFCMALPRYGYYVHGRNANGFGDCSVAEMNAFLRREGRYACFKRGLPPEPDHQTYVMLLPRVINEHYKRLMYRDELSSSFRNRTTFVDQLNTALLSQNSANNVNKRLIGDANIETIVAKNRAINTFLTNFIEHVYKDIDYCIRKQRQFENLLIDFNANIDNNRKTGDDGSNAPDAPILRKDALNMSTASTHEDITRATSPIGATTSSIRLGQPAASLIGGGGGGGGVGRSAQAIFCKDTRNSFASLLWLGLELDLVCVELTSLLIFDIILSSLTPLPSCGVIVVSASLVWLAYQMMERLYVAIASQNIVNKALVDEKFLCI